METNIIYFEQAVHDRLHAYTHSNEVSRQYSDILDYALEIKAKGWAKLKRQSDAKLRRQAKKSKRTKRTQKVHKKVHKKVH